MKSRSNLQEIKPMGKTGAPVKGKIDTILQDVLSGGRLSAKDALLVFKNAGLHQLGRAADTIRKKHHQSNHVGFIIDRNINYTNVCTSGCGFCAFYKDKDDPDAYLLTTPEVLQKVGEAARVGGTQIMLQGGLHPDLKIEYYTNLFKAIKERYDVVIHSLSPPEIMHIAKNSSLGVKETLIGLRDAGLDSLPGGGAEILSDATRQRISPKKISAGSWLAVMRAAHAVGLFSTATMMFGIGEGIQERIHHLSMIREVQDATGKFRAFIPWTFQPGHTDIGGEESSVEDYLRTLSISRIFLDNIANIQGSWLTQGDAVGQISLFFGANDLGSTMLEENVVRSTGVSNTMSVDKIVHLIKSGGFTPVQRDTEYKPIRIY